MSLEAWGDENPMDAEYESWADRARDAGWLDPDDYSPGAIAILEEREAQETREGRSPEHDDAYERKELQRAAECYLTSARLGDIGGLEAPAHWPWDKQWWKPKDPRADLVRAGALIAAEIDRLDRVQAKSQTQEAPDEVAT